MSGGRGSAGAAGVVATSLLPRKSIAKGISASSPRRVVTSARRVSFGSPELTTVLLVGIGAALRLWQYLAHSSLWIDEAALARNLIDHSPAALLGPLDYAQSAPVGFLIVEKSAIATFGTSEYVLRLWPLVCGLASLILFVLAVRRLLTGWAVTFAVGLFSLGIPFVYFSSQVKQYSSDVAVSLLLLWGTLEIRSRGITTTRAVLLGVAGAVCVWFSNTAIVVVAGLGAALMAATFIERDGSGARRLTITWLLWGVSAALAAVLAVSSVDPTDREYFHWFWADGFMPIPPKSASDVLWLPRRLVWIFGAFAPGLGHTNGGLNYRWSPVFAIVMLYGYGVLWRKQRDTALLLALPVVMAIGFSAVSVYPFAARLVAFVIPFFLIALAVGSTHLLSNLPARLQFLSPLALAILGGAPIYAIATALPPSWVQHIRPVMAHMAERFQPGDRIYVYSGAGLAFSYYAPRVNIPQSAALLGRCHLSDPRGYLRELDSLRGEPRVWVLVTHEQRAGELELILGYLDALGRRLDEMTILASNKREIEAAHGYLYDLSGATRVESSLSETFRLPSTLTPLSGGIVRWGCYGITGGEPSR